jgi:hypothetical protein
MRDAEYSERTNQQRGERKRARRINGNFARSLAE